MDERELNKKADRAIGIVAIIAIVALVLIDSQSADFEVERWIYGILLSVVAPKEVIERILGIFKK